MEESEEKQVEAKRSLLVGDIQEQRENSIELSKMRNRKF